MSFTPTKLGHCDCCYHPNADRGDIPLEVTTYDAGGGDMREQQLCEVCTAQGQLDSITAIADMHTTGGVDLPGSFFAGDGTLRLPPWHFAGTTIDILKNNRDKTITIVIPVSCMRMMTNDQIVRLIGLTEALAAAFSRVVPEGWTVRA